MTLEQAVTQLCKEFGTGKEPAAKIAGAMEKFGIASNVPQGTLDKLLKLGRTLRNLGVK